MTCGIYKITNTATGEFYIGKSKNIERRWEDHKRRWRNGSERYCQKLTRNAIQYGIEMFVFEVVEECEERDLTDKELLHINRLNPHLNCEMEIARSRNAGRYNRRHVLRELRERSGVSREAVAVHLKVTLLTVQNWERGKTLVAQEKIAPLAALYNCTPEEIFKALSA